MPTKMFKIGSLHIEIMQTKLQIISGVLFTKMYIAIAAFSGIGLGIIYYTLTMSMMPSHFDADVELSSMSHIASSIALTIIISILAGINFAMMAFKIKMMRRTSSVTGMRTGPYAIFGSIFAAFTPGCPACTAPLAVILGTVGGLSLFPMQGLELKLVSVGVLCLSIWWIARGLQHNRSCCKIG